MKSIERVFPAIIIFMITTLLLFGWLVYDYSRQVMLLPALTGIATVCFCLVLIISGRNDRSRAPRKNPLQQKRDEANSWRNLLHVCAIIPVLAIFGFVVGPAVYTTGFLKLRGESWRMACSLGFGTLLFVSMVFLKLLNVPLPSGMLGW